MTLCRQTPAAGVGSGHVLVPQACSRPAQGGKLPWGFEEAGSTGHWAGRGWAEEEREALFPTEETHPQHCCCFRLLLASEDGWRTLGEYSPFPQAPSHSSTPPLTCSPAKSLLYLRPASYSQYTEHARVEGWPTDRQSCPSESPTEWLPQPGWVCLLGPGVSPGWSGRASQRR